MGSGRGWSKIKCRRRLREVSLTTPCPAAGSLYQSSTPVSRAKGSSQSGSPFIHQAAPTPDRGGRSLRGPRPCDFSGRDGALPCSPYPAIMPGWPRAPIRAAPHRVEDLCCPCGRRCRTVEGSGIRGRRTASKDVQLRRSPCRCLNQVKGLREPPRTRAETIEARQAMPAHPMAARAWIRWNSTSSSARPTWWSPRP